MTTAYELGVSAAFDLFLGEKTAATRAQKVYDRALRNPKVAPERLEVLRRGAARYNEIPLGKTDTDIKTPEIPESIIRHTYKHELIPESLRTGHSPQWRRVTLDPPEVERIPGKSSISLAERGALTPEQKRLGRALRGDIVPQLTPEVLDTAAYFGRMPKAQTVHPDDPLAWLGYVRMNQKRDPEFGEFRPTPRGQRYGRFGPRLLRENAPLDPRSGRPVNYPYGTLSTSLPPTQDIVAGVPQMPGARVTNRGWARDAERSKIVPPPAPIPEGRQTPMQRVLDDLLIERGSLPEMLKYMHVPASEAYVRDTAASPGSEVPSWYREILDRRANALPTWLQARHDQINQGE